jgi:hypothetical protein
MSKAPESTTKYITWLDGPYTPSPAARYTGVKFAECGYFIKAGATCVPVPVRAAAIVAVPMPFEATVAGDPALVGRLTVTPVPNANVQLLPLVAPMGSATVSVRESSAFAIAPRVGPTNKVCVAAGGDLAPFESSLTAVTVYVPSESAVDGV